MISGMQPSVLIVLYGIEIVENHKQRLGMKSSNCTFMELK